MFKKKMSPRCLIQGFFFFSFFLVALCFLIPAATFAYGILAQGYLVSRTTPVEVDHMALCGVVCKDVSVSNADTRTYFVPTKTCDEWEKFRENKPGTVSVLNCAVDNCITPFDYMGVTYNGEYVGDQCWLTDNLNAGTTTGAFADDGVIQKRCYSNSASNCSTYGALYSWDEAMAYSTSSPQGICPTGWHLPTENEIMDLLAYAGLNSPTNTVTALNTLSSYGFNLQMSGRQNYDSTFSYLTQQGWILSSTVNPDPVNGGPLSLWLSASPSYSWAPGANLVEPDYNYSVRCIKDGEFIGGGMPMD